MTTSGSKILDKEENFGLNRLVDNMQSISLSVIQAMQLSHVIANTNTNLAINSPLSPPGIVCIIDHVMHRFVKRCLFTPTNF